MKIKVLLACAAIAFFCGCRSTPSVKIIDLDGETGTNEVQRVSGGFSDMTFIWETWIYGTNTVNRKD